MADKSPLRRGILAKLYRNTAAYASPTWDELTNVSDPKLALSKSEADATARYMGGFKAVTGTLKEVEYSFQAKGAEGDAEMQMWWEAFWGDELLDLAAFEAPSNEEDCRGVHCMWEVMTCDRSEDNEGLVVYDITIKPGYYPGRVPETLE